jgi:hypothetical protein
MGAGGRSARGREDTGAERWGSLHWCVQHDGAVFTRDDLHGWRSALGRSAGGTVRTAVDLHGVICLKGGVSEGILVVGRHRGSTASRSSGRMGERSSKDSDWLHGCHFRRSDSVGGPARRWPGVPFEKGKQLPPVLKSALSKIKTF